MATLIRLELTQPGSGLFIGNGGSYHIVVAIHAILMVFFVVTPVVFGGFGNYFLPTQVGARDVAYPRLNNFSVWLLPAGLLSTLRALWDGVRISNLTTISEAQYSGSRWSNAGWGGGPGAGYEGSAELYTIQQYMPGGGAGSAIGAGSALGSRSDLLLDNIASFLPRPQMASDLTMTMAG